MTQPKITYDFKQGDQVYTINHINCPGNPKLSVPKGVAGKIVGPSKIANGINLFPTEINGNSYLIDASDLEPLNPNTSTTNPDGPVKVCFVEANGREIFLQTFPSEEEFWIAYNEAYHSPGRYMSITQEDIGADPNDDPVHKQRIIDLSYIREIRLMKQGKTGFKFIKRQLQIKRTIARD